MAKENANPPTPPKERKVLCPECETQVDLEEVDECPKCGLDVEKVYTQLRYRRALKKLEDGVTAEETAGKKKKKAAGDFNPFA